MSVVFFTPRAPQPKLCAQGSEHLKINFDKNLPNAEPQTWQDTVIFVQPAVSLFRRASSVKAIETWVHESLKSKSILYESFNIHPTASGYEIYAKGKLKKIIPIEIQAKCIVDAEKRTIEIITQPNAIFKSLNCKLKFDSEKKDVDVNPEASHKARYEIERLKSDMHAIETAQKNNDFHAAVIQKMDRLIVTNPAAKVINFDTMEFDDSQKLKIFNKKCELYLKYCQDVIQLNENLEKPLQYYSAVHISGSAELKAIIGLGANLFSSHSPMKSVQRVIKNSVHNFLNNITG